MHSVQYGLGELNSTLETQFVLPELVGQVDLEPAKALVSKLAALCKQQHTPRDIMTHMVEVWRYWIDPASKVAVVREKYLLTAFQAAGYTQSQQPFTAKTVLLSILLVLLEKFELVSEGGIFDHFWCDSPLIVPFGHPSKSPSYGPDVLHSLQDLVVHLPFDASQNVKNLAHRLYI